MTLTGRTADEAIASEICQAYSTRTASWEDAEAISQGFRQLARRRSPGGQTIIVKHCQNSVSDRWFDVTGQQNAALNRERHC